MSSKQAVRTRCASARVQREHRFEPAPLYSFAGTGVPPLSPEAGMRTPANDHVRRLEDITVAMASDEVRS